MDEGKIIRNILRSYQTIIIQQEAGFAVGESLKAFVTSNYSPRQYILTISGKNILARSTVDLPVGETIELKVLSVDPRPVLEFVGNSNTKGQEAELLPTIITISAGDSEKAINTFINKIGQEIEAQVTKQDTQPGIEVKIDGKSFAGEVSKPLSGASNLTLKIVSLFPKIALEIVPRSPILRDESFLNLLFEYFDTKEVPPDGENSPEKLLREGEQVLSTSFGSAFEASHQNKLGNARVWRTIIESIAESILSEDTLEPKEKTKHEMIVDGTIRSLAHSINGEIAGDNKIFLPFPFPLEH